MSSDQQAYFAQRAAEEQAASETASCTAAASAHRELALRYELGVILPRPASASEDARPIGLPRRSADRAPGGRPRPAAKRRSA